MNFGRKLTQGLKFGKKALKDTQKFGKKVSRETKKATRNFNTEAKKVSNQLEKGARKVDNTNLYVPLLNNAKGVVSSGMRNVAGASRLAGKTGMLASDVTRGDLNRLQKRSQNVMSDAKDLSGDVLETAGKGGKVYAQGARLASGDLSALIV